MKTTIDLPDNLFEQTKVAAARRRTTLKQLVVQGLEMVLREDAAASDSTEALQRLRSGYALGGTPFKREDAHAR